MSHEIWLDIPGYEGSYQVSDHGRVRSLDRAWLQRSRGGSLYLYQKKGRILRPGRKPSGHVSVFIGRSSKDVHALVLLAFIAPRPEGLEARHKNGIPDDNRLDNLEYATRSRNTQDKKWHKGATTYRLSPREILSIKRRLGPRSAAASLAREYGVSKSTIYAIRYGVVHRDVVLP